MKVIIKGKGEVELSQQDFVAEGGQGKVYAKNDTAFKIYHDPAHMIPEGKIKELFPLPTPLFNRPHDLLIDKKGQVVGYTTPFIKDAYVLCQLFPRSFRNREGLTHQHTFALAEKMRDGIGQAHKANILLVDGNEMNVLVNSDFSNLTFIDTDSYQTRSYPAVAIMESIRDRHMKNPRAFDEGTDWFSFACVSFQLLTGIHPYKGKHPALKGFDARMKANVSVLNKDVKVPGSTYDFGVIPPDWRSWYEAVLERGERVPPPGGVIMVGIVTPVVKTITGATNLILDEIHSYPGEITGIWASGSKLVVATTKGLWYDNRQVSSWQNTIAVGFSPLMGTPVAVSHSGGALVLEDIQTRSPVPFGMKAQRVTCFDGRVYIKNHDKVVEVTLNDVGKVVASTRVVASVLPNASMLFPGGVVQDMLGSTFVSLFPKSGQTYQIRIPELDGYRVLEAKYDAGAQGGVLMVIGVTAKGQYDRLVFRFDSRFHVYDVRLVEDVGQAGLNFAVTDAGVCVVLNEDDKIELSSTRIGSSTVKNVTDNVLGGDMRLFKRGAEILVAKGQRIYTMRMK